MSRPTSTIPPTEPAAFRRGAGLKPAALRRAKKALGEEGAHLGKEAFRTPNRSVRRLRKKLHRIALRKGEKAKEKDWLRPTKSS